MKTTKRERVIKMTKDFCKIFKIPFENVMLTELKDIIANPSKLNVEQRTKIRDVVYDYVPD